MSDGDLLIWLQRFEQQDIKIEALATGRCDRF